MNQHLLLPPPHAAIALLRELGTNGPISVDAGSTLEKDETELTAQW